jgi:hypothetical protein
MIEKHSAGIIENRDGVQVPPERQIGAVRAAGGRSMDVSRRRPRQSPAA